MASRGYLAAAKQAARLAHATQPMGQASEGASAGPTRIIPAVAVQQAQPAAQQVHNHIYLLEVAPAAALMVRVAGRDERAKDAHDRGRVLSHLPYHCMQGPRRAGDAAGRLLPFIGGACVGAIGLACWCVLAHCGQLWFGCRSSCIAVHGQSQQLHWHVRPLSAGKAHMLTTARGHQRVPQPATH